MPDYVNVTTRAVDVGGCPVAPGGVVTAEKQAAAHGVAVGELREVKTKPTARRTASGKKEDA